MSKPLILHRFPIQSKPKVTGETKICKLCPENGPQPLENFYKSAHTRDGRLGTCRVCETKKRNEKEEERKFYTGF